MKMDASGGSGTAWGVLYCMSLINTLNCMMASSALSQNGQLDGAGMARTWAGRVWFSAATEMGDRGVSGEQREVEHA